MINDFLARVYMYTLALVYMHEAIHCTKTVVVT